MILCSRYNTWKAFQFLKRYGEYERYINEKVVILNNKGFKYFPKEIFYLKELKLLHLYKNQISLIPKEIYYLKKLEILHLDNNQITHIPKEISHLKNSLKTLWIKSNPLEQQTKEDIQELLPNTKIWI